jgi:hypothetical protein
MKVVNLMSRCVKVDLGTLKGSLKISTDLGLWLRLIQLGET